MAFDKEKFIADLEAMTVLELKELVTTLEEHFGVTAAAPVAVVAGAAGGEVAEEKTEFDVVLKSIDMSKKIAVIKEIRALTGLGLKEGKELAEAGGVIKEAVSKEDAEAIKEKFVAAGAEIEIK